MTDGSDTDTEGNDSRVFVYSETEASDSPVLCAVKPRAVTLTVMFVCSKSEGSDSHVCVCVYSATEGSGSHSCVYSETEHK